MPPGSESRSGPSRAVLGREPDTRFDEPTADDRLSWATPEGHGTWKGIDLELLDPGDEDELGLLVEALHDCQDLSWSGLAATPSGPVGNPRLHVAMHQIVSRQLRADDPPQTWQTVQRLAGLGYGWHDIMHMIAGLVAQDVGTVFTTQRRFDPADYIRRLDDLPADWPAPPA